MINSISNVSSGIEISGGSSPYVQQSGMVRWNGSLQTFEIADGLNWVSLFNTYTTIALSPEVISVVEWAKNKMHAEQQLDKLCEEYPIVKDAKENFDMILALVKKHDEKK
jgi:hypothetical protein